MKDNYYILLNRKDLIEVSEDIWKVYYRMRAKERYMLKVYNERCISLESQFYEGAYYGALKHLTESPEDLVMKKMMNEYLYSAIYSLSVNERTVIFRYFFLGYTETEIGKYLGISQQAVSLRKRNALRKLKDILRL